MENKDNKVKLNNVSESKIWRNNKFLNKHCINWSVKDNAVCANG